MKLFKLSQSLAADEIVAVELLHIPYETRTRSRVDIDLLEKMTADAQAKCTLLLTHETSVELNSIVSELTLIPVSRAPDLRWGVRFVDSNGVVKYAIYLSGQSIAGTATHGLVDGQAFDVRGRLVGWLESSLASHCPKVSL